MSTSSANTINDLLQQLYPADSVRVRTPISVWRRQHLDKYGMPPGFAKYREFLRSTLPKPPENEYGPLCP